MLQGEAGGWCADFVISNLWSDDQVACASAYSLSQRLLALGVQPKRRRPENCALLKKVQALVLAEPPWDPPVKGGSGDEGPFYQASAAKPLRAKEATPELVRRAVLEDAQLHELVLVHAPVPLERFMLALQAIVPIKQGSTATETAVREALQAQGVLFTSAWRGS
jgi:hypothetical protein